MLNYLNHNVVDKLMFGGNVVKVLHDLAKLEHLLGEFIFWSSKCQSLCGWPAASSFCADKPARCAGGLLGEG